MRRKRPWSPPPCTGLPKRSTFRGLLLLQRQMSFRVWVSLTSSSDYCWRLASIFSSHSRGALILMSLCTLTHSLVLRDVSIDGDAGRRLGWCIMILFYLSLVLGGSTLFWEDDTEAVCFASMIVNLHAAYGYKTESLWHMICTSRIRQAASECWSATY